MNGFGPVCVIDDIKCLDDALVGHGLDQVILLLEARDLGLGRILDLELLENHIVSLALFASTKHARASGLGDRLQYLVVRDLLHSFPVQTTRIAMVSVLNAAG